MTFDPATSPLAPFLPLLDGSLDPIGLVDADGRYVWVNDARARFFGYDRHEVVGMHFRDHLREDETPGDAMRRAQRGNPAAVVRRVRRKDGSVAVVRTELIPALDGLVLIHATDLTSLYETLERVSESEGVLARAQDIGHTGSWVLRLPERTVRWFGPMGELLGVEPGSFLGGREVADALVHPGDSAAPDRLVVQALAGGSADGEFRTVHPERGLRWLRMYVHAIRDETTNEVARVEGVVHDITEYREQEERYRELLEAVRVPMMIWRRTREGAPAEGILYANEAFGTLVGAAPEQILGHRPMQWINFDDLPEVIRYCDSVESGAYPPHLVVRLLRDDGAPVTAIFAAARVSFGGREAMCAQLIDISEEVRLRELAARARETDLALAVAGGVAHDFNNILTGVLGYLDFAAAELGADSPEARYVAAARLAARRAANLAQALLGFSRGSAAVEDPDRPPVIDPTHVVDVTDVVRETFAITRAAIDRRVAMIAHEGEEPAHAAIPADSLLRVLVNLLVNSRDAVLERAQAAGPEYRPQIDLTVRALPPLGTLEIAVADNGTGIPVEVAARIFEPYFTTKSARGGSGIGLRAARDLARAAGGELSFFSEPGAGTTFRLTLPLVAAPATIEF